MGQYLSEGVFAKGLGTLLDEREVGDPGCIPNESIREAYKPN